MEREKREALLKEENEKLTVDLEELQSQLSTATTQISHLEGFKQVVNDKSRQIEELQRTLKAFEARVVEVEEILDRRSKENSELRLLLGKKRQDKSEPSVKSRTSNKNVSFLSLPRSVARILEIWEQRI
jgi:DNA repair exonuclease SbcCD ATPase subunit